LPKGNSSWKNDDQLVEISAPTTSPQQLAGDRRLANELLGRLNRSVANRFIRMKGQRSAQSSARPFDPALPSRQLCSEFRSTSSILRREVAGTLSSNLDMVFPRESSQ
jgi:hypothetical protein